MVLAVKKRHFFGTFPHGFLKREKLRTSHAKQHFLNTKTGRSTAVFKLKEPYTNPKATRKTNFLSLKNHNKTKNDTQNWAFATIQQG